MKTLKSKIKNIDHLNAATDEYTNSGYSICSRKDKPKLRITFKETAYQKKQKTVYFN